MKASAASEAQTSPTLTGCATSGEGAIGPSAYSARSRQLSRAEGLAYARRWRAQHVATAEHMPFAGHRSCADWS